MKTVFQGWWVQSFRDLLVGKWSLLIAEYIEKLNGLFARSDCRTVTNINKRPFCWKKAASIKAAFLNSLSRALALKLVYGIAHCFCIRRLLIEILANVPRGLELGSKLLHVAIDFGISSSIFLVPGSFHCLGHLAKRFDLTRIIFRLLERLDGRFDLWIGSRCSSYGEDHTRC